MLSGDLSVNYLTATTTTPTCRLSGWGLGAGLTWAPTMLTTVHGTIGTSIEDTTQATSSGYFRTMYSVRVDHELLRDLQIMGQLSYYVNDYQLLPTAPEGARKEDTLFNVDVGATYFINRSVWLSASYKYGNFDTNVRMTISEQTPRGWFSGLRDKHRARITLRLFPCCYCSGLCRCCTGAKRNGRS